MAYLLNYTRKPIDEFLYDPKLAYSMHLALSEDGASFSALNHNSGVLFARATENPDGSLNAKSLKNPWLFSLPKGGYGVVAIRVGGNEEDDGESRGSVLCFRTENLVDYEELGLLKLGTDYVEHVRCGCRKGSPDLVIAWQERNGGCYRSILKSVPDSPFFEIRLGRVPEICGEPWDGAVPHNIIEISDREAEYLRRKLLTPFNTGMEVPETIEVSDPEQLSGVRALALYSDGTRAFKRVDWDLSGVDFGKKGSYPISGRIHQEHFAFPVACNRADPCICRWNRNYYFIATNDADGNHTLFIRKASCLSELAGAEEHLLLDSGTYPGIGGLLWAPEFHEINGRLYLFHAATPGEFFYEESHVMALREGGDPLCREDWSAPKRVVRRDGSDLCEAGKEITLDMTCFCWQGEWYAVWSQRQFLPRDLGAWLYIARLDPEEPWRLLTEPRVLSKPEYGWANNHTFVDEGPFALIGEDRLYLTFSSAAVDTSYVVGLLTLPKGADPLDVRAWKKKNYPILTSRSVEGEFGTGHNSYVTDEDGNVWNVYHARPGIHADRCSGIRRVHFDVDGEPVLDLTEDLDVAEQYRTVHTCLIVKG